MSEVPIHQGWFDEENPPDPNLKVDLLLIERALPTYSGSAVGLGHAPWYVSGALTREAEGSVEWVPGWVDATYADAPPEGLWGYLVDKGGGNYYTYGIACLRIALKSDAAKVAAHYDRLYRENFDEEPLTGGPQTSADTS